MTLPYAAMPRPTSCAAYAARFPGSLPGGAYLIDLAGADTLVFCDMSAGSGVTYEGFGFGNHTATYPGWEWVGGPDFASNAALRDAFVLHYNRLRGLRNLEVGYNSGNCCIQNPPSAPQSWYGFAGARYMYPANTNAATTLNCNDGYNSSLVRLFLMPMVVGRTSFTSSEVANVTYTSECRSIDNNPAIFVRRYR